MGKVMDQVSSDGTPILLTRQRGEPLVMSLVEYNALESRFRLGDLLCLNACGSWQRLSKGTQHVRRGCT